MMRMLFWLAVWLLFLGAADIDVKYKDGLHIQLKGWLCRLFGKGR